jgi:hypothetical protein
MTTTQELCPYCSQPKHNVLVHSEQRHGTAVYAALDLHVGHTLTVQPGPLEVSLYCSDCKRAVITAGNRGRWRSEYKMPECRVGQSMTPRIRVP